MPCLSFSTSSPPKSPLLGLIKFRGVLSHSDASKSLRFPSCKALPYAPHMHRNGFSLSDVSTVDDSAVSRSHAVLSRVVTRNPSSRAFAYHASSVLIRAVRELSSLPSCILLSRLPQYSVPNACPHNASRLRSRRELTPPRSSGWLKGLTQRFSIALPGIEPREPE